MRRASRAAHTIFSTRRLSLAFQVLRTSEPRSQWQSPFNPTMTLLKKIAWWLAAGGLLTACATSIQPTPSTLTPRPATPFPPTVSASPPAIPPVSEMFPLASYTIVEQREIGHFTLALWDDESANDAFDSVATIARDGQNLALVEFATGFDPLTGRDITGEGNPDVVVRSFSGGAHCCSATYVYDLGAALTPVLETAPSNCDGVFEDLDGDGTLEFVTCDDVFAYAYCPYAFLPHVRMVLQYQPGGGGYVHASPRFPDLYAEDIAAHQQLAAASVVQGGGQGEWDGTNKCGALPLALDYLYTGRYGMAWHALERYYPYDDLDAFWAEVAQRVSPALPEPVPYPYAYP